MTDPMNPATPPDAVHATASAPCKASQVPIGAHVRNPLFGTWQQVADVVRVRDGSGDIRLTFTDGGRFGAGPNDPVEIRATDEGA